MSGQSNLITESEANHSPSVSQVSEANNQQHVQSTEGTGQEKNDNIEADVLIKVDEEEFHEEEEVFGSAALEPSTLPWPGDEMRRLELENKGLSSENTAETIERDQEDMGRGSQGLSEDQSQPDTDRKGKDQWRESMPEGERWRDEDIDMDRRDKGDGSFADDEEEEDEEPVNWMPEKAALVFTPQVNIVHQSSKEIPQESSQYIDRDTENELQTKDPASADQMYSEWTGDDKYNAYVSDNVCGEKLKLGLGTAAAAVIFPFLVWGGYALLPFDVPLLGSAPVRLVYTLRCSFFAIIPIVLGVLVQGVARLRYSALSPLYEGKLENREVVVHGYFVNESLSLFLVYFLQLAVMATYISQDLLKLVPLLTIIFAFGRLIYWVCLSLGSSVRGLGFGLSFFPILVMLGTNLYYVCSSLGVESIFDVAPPTTAPTPIQRFWG